MASRNQGRSSIPRSPRPTNPNSPRSTSSSPRRPSRQRSSTADERNLNRLGGGHNQTTRITTGGRQPRNSPRKREAVSAGYFAPQISNGNRGVRGRNNRSNRRGNHNNASNNQPVKSEADLLPIEWRCRTPPQRHDEVSPLLCFPLFYSLQLNHFIFWHHFLNFFLN